MTLPSENAPNAKSRNMKLIMIGLPILALVGIAGIYAMSASPEPDPPATQQPTDERVQESRSIQMKDANIMNENGQKRTMDAIDGEENTQRPAKCNLLCDHTGYEPAWVTEGMGKFRATSICINIMDAGKYEILDWDWCGELGGYMLDLGTSSTGTDRSQVGAGCNLFCDHTGYEPDWVTKSMGQNRVLGICENKIHTDTYENPDWNWCGEFMDYLLDNPYAAAPQLPAEISPSPPGTTCNLFCDYTGYEPDWVTEGMGKFRATSICINIMDSGTYEIQDWNWCGELGGYMLDLGVAGRH